MNTQNKPKTCIAKIVHQKKSRRNDSNLHLWQSLDDSSHAFTMFLSSELCSTLVIQRDFYTSIIVIVAFNAGIEAGSINYLPYIVLHARLYTIARRWIYIYNDTHDPIVKAPVAVQWTV